MDKKVVAVFGGKCLGKGSAEGGVDDGDGDDGGAKFDSLHTRDYLIPCLRVQGDDEDEQ